MISNTSVFLHLRAHKAILVAGIIFGAFFHAQPASYARSHKNKHKKRIHLDSKSKVRGSQYLVRFKNPALARSHQTSLDGGRGGVLASRWVNADEGLLSLEFKNEAQARESMDRLAHSGAVVSISPNMLYFPQMSYDLRDASPEEARLHRSKSGEFGGIKPSSMGSRDIWSEFQNGLNGWFPRDADDRADRPVPGNGGGKVARPKRKPSPEVELPPSREERGVDPKLADDWAMKNVRVPLGTKAGTLARAFDRNPVTVAVIDTGVDYNHEDLISSMWRSDKNPRVVGYDFAHDKPLPYDVRQFDPKGYFACLQNKKCASDPTLVRQFLANPGHGTHCAGHTSATEQNAKGIRGVGAGSQVMALKFFYDVGEANAGSGDDAAAVRSIDYAIKNGAKVISASWGGRMPRDIADSSELKRSIERARDAGVLFVVAAGNDGIDQDKDKEPSFPAAFTDIDNMISVAATDSDDEIAEFSNFGTRSVHIAAPGVKILSTTVGNNYDDVVARFTDPTGKVEVIDWDGTSMAAPIVAGAAALIWAQEPNLTYRQVKARLLTSVRKVPGLKGTVLTGGVLDVEAALRKGLR